MSTAGFHITEDGAEVYLKNESDMEFLRLAERLHDFLRQEQCLPARSFLRHRATVKKSAERRSTSWSSAA